MAVREMSMKRTLWGLVALCLLATPASAQSKRLMQNADDAFAALNEQLTLRFLDAVTGKPIPGASVTFEGEQQRTDAEGAVTFDEPGDLGDDDTRVALFEHPKYVKSAAQVRFMMGKIFFNRYSISPALPPGRIRVVLDWNATPRDLDAHLEKKGVYHLSFRQKKNYKDIAWLDRDDQDGFGPETVTVEKLDPKARYSYVVHDFTNRTNPSSTKLGSSRAHVRIYTTEGILKTFVAPSGAKGSTWHVFDVIKGQITPVNRIKSGR